MKKIFYLMTAAVICVSCEMGNSGKTEQLVDSLKNANSMLKNGYDDLISTVNQINAGFSQIADAEGRINSITFDEAGEMKDAVPTQTIKDNMQYIVDVLAKNKEQIKLLESKLTDAEYSSQELQTLVSSLKGQLETKQKEVLTLKNQLEEKNVQIGKMGDQINNLVNENTAVKEENENVKAENTAVKAENESVKAENTAVKAENENVKAENEQVKKDNKEKEQVLANQDAQLNTAYYVFGTKKELKQQNILSNGEILTKANFDKSYFTKIDIRNTTTIPLQSKSTELLSKHPAGSYTMLKDSKGEYTLKITNPSDFWSLTRYLVIRVK